MSNLNFWKLTEKIFLHFNLKTFPYEMKFSEMFQVEIFL